MEVNLITAIGIQFRRAFVPKMHVGGASISESKVTRKNPGRRYHVNVNSLADDLASRFSKSMQILCDEEAVPRRTGIAFATARCMIKVIL